MKFADVKQHTNRIDCKFNGSWEAPSTIVVTATLKKEFKDWTNEWQDEVRCGEALLNVSPHALYISHIKATPVGRGFGSEILDEIIAAAQANGMSKITAYVEGMNANSRNMFRSKGFTEIPGKDGGYWTLVFTDEINEGGEAIMPISMFKVVISPHVEEQRAKPERNITWIEIYRILKRIPRIKKQLEQMMHFPLFYIRDAETGAELGCKIKENNPARPAEDARLKYVIYFNTVVRNNHLRTNSESPIIEV